MFLAPENRQPGPPPEPPKPKRILTAREKVVLPWVIGFIVVTLVLAPIGGSTVVEALWYLMSAHKPAGAGHAAQGSGKPAEPPLFRH